MPAVLGTLVAVLFLSAHSASEEASDCNGKYIVNTQLSVDALVVYL